MRIGRTDWFDSQTENAGTFSRGEAAGEVLVRIIRLCAVYRLGDWMELLKWANKKVGKMDAMDMGFTKLAVFFFALMAVALMPQLASLDWYYYAGAWIIFMIKPLLKVLGK